MALDSSDISKIKDTLHEEFYKLKEDLSEKIIQDAKEDSDYRRIKDRIEKIEEILNSEIKDIREKVTLMQEDLAKIHEKFFAG